MDTLLEASVRASFQQQLDQINWGVSPAHDFSDRHKARIQKILLPYKRRERRRKLARAAGRIAIALLIVFAMLTAAVLSIEDVRAEVSRIIIQWFEKHMDIRFQSDSGQPAPEVDLRESGMMLPSYLPQGYREREVVRSFATVSAAYVNDQDLDIFYAQRILEYYGRFSLDTDNRNVASVIPVEVNGVEGVALISSLDDKYSSITWQDDTFAYLINAYTDLDMLLRIAQSVQQIK